MEQRTVYTTGVNDADGFTNGFYIGHPRPLSQVMGPVRVAHSQLMKLDIGSGVYDGATYPNNYEVLLRRAFEQHGILHRQTGLIFFKIRASGQPFWQGDKSAQLRALSNASQQIVLGEWTSVLERQCAEENQHCQCGTGLVRFGYDSDGPPLTAKRKRSNTWTSWRHVNTGSPYAYVECSRVAFGVGHWVTAPGSQPICQCRMVWAFLYLSVY